MSVYSGFEYAPSDPIMGMTEAFNQDPAPQKVNLGVGVYLDETGKTPLMACVDSVEQELAACHRPRGYLPMDGMPSYNEAVQELVFGVNSPARLSGRVVTMQALAGTGALRLGAGVLALASPNAAVYLSDPSWENHELLFSRAGFPIRRYRYYDRPTRSLDVEGMLEDLSQADPGSIIVLHACCHNPTGYDLNEADWLRVIDVCRERNLVPFLDMAYQGLSRGIEEDAYAVRAFAESELPFLIANSFSKTFGLYGERIGAIHFVASDSDEAAKVLSQAKLVVRSMYSNPCTQGAAIVSTVLTTPELRALWEQELGQMRSRIKQMRVDFRAGLEAAGISQDVSYITSQAGMFSYSGLSVEQMRQLRSEFHVYGLDSGRLCMAGLNRNNLDYVVGAVAHVMG